MDKIYNLPVTEAELNILLKGLGEIPAKFSVNLITKIQTIYRESTKESTSKDLERLQG